MVVSVLGSMTIVHVIHDDTRTPRLKKRSSHHAQISIIPRVRTHKRNYSFLLQTKQFTRRSHPQGNSGRTRRRTTNGERDQGRMRTGGTPQREERGRHTEEEAHTFTQTHTRGTRTRRGGSTHAKRKWDTRTQREEEHTHPKGDTRTQGGRGDTHPPIGRRRDRHTHTLSVCVRDQSREEGTRTHPKEEHAHMLKGGAH